MKELKDKSLDFVLRYYQAGKFDTQRAMRKLMPHRATTIPLWRKWAVAASLALLLLGGAYATYRSGLLTGESQQQKQEQTQTAPQPQHFHFDHTPLPQVLQTLGEHYGVTLTASATDKQLSADFDATSLDETVMMIERVLDVKITIEEK